MDEPSAIGNQSPINHFYDLDVWKEAHNLCISVYKLCEELPRDEKYNIIDQVKRASCSVGANIAEGFGRFHYREKIKFYYNARGSVCEVQNFLFLSQDLGYIDRDIARELFAKYENLNKRINQFIKSVHDRMNDD